LPLCAGVPMGSREMVNNNARNFLMATIELYLSG
jgi:hypothetical protein